MESVSDLAALVEKARALRQLPPPAERRRIRLEAGVTQQELAAALGASRVSISRWEKGARLPRGDSALRYSRALERLLKLNEETT